MTAYTHLKALDERVKLLITVSAGGLAMAGIQWQTNLALLSVSLLLCLLCRARAGVLVFLAVTGLYLAGVFLFKIISGSPNIPGMGLMFLVLKFGPFCAMMVFLYKTVNTSLFLKAMRKMKVPAAVVVPLGVTLRFIPSFVREFSHIRDALKFRGMDLNAKTLFTRPFTVMEFVLVPLLMRCLFIGEELSRAALARGLGSPVMPTSFYDIRFNRTDALWSVLWLVGIGCVFYLDQYLGAS